MDFKSTRAAQWRVIRYMATFKTADIAQATGVKTCTVTEFVRQLKNARMIKAIDRTGHMKVWRLIRDFGPKTPVKYGDGLLNPNDGIVYAFTTGARHER